MEQFLYKQLEALPPGWTPGWAPGKLLIWAETDSDATWASWAVFTGFNYKGGLESIREEIHVFRSSFVARLIPYPSPSSLSAGKGYTPEGWSYRPLHANRFEFGCEGGDGVSQPERCSCILRYEEYIIVFDTPIADYMTLEDLQRIMEVIDREMTDYLKHSTLRPGPRLVLMAIP
ncbi:MAG: hypothetical protein H5T61_15675 [Thermoflexales bacterium]|nr:hypothetical protein [Thermoflexales bacterium]